MWHHVQQGDPREGLVNLTRLNLSDNSLDLSYNYIGAEGAQALKGLVNLTSLDLDGCRLAAKRRSSLGG